jgi:glycosyltransferase involved in cell wall biosynthesis
MGPERQLHDCGIPLFSLGMKPGIPDPRGLARLIVLLSRFRPQILHSHMFHANALARAARLFCPVPVLISSLHSAAEIRGGAGVSACHWTVRARDFVYRLTDPLADAVVAVSQAAADRHAASGAVRRRKLRVIPNGVDTTLFRPDPERRARTRRDLGIESRFVWLAAGRLMWKKDHATLFRAFATLAPATLLVAGEGPLADDLRRFAHKLSIDVRFLGRVDDMPALMNAADALVLSSVVEGLPMALLEAAASGLPAVTTDAGGAREIVVDGVTGFVAPPGDSAALAAAMSRLAALALEARQRMSSAARASSARFEIQDVVSRWEACYRELLESGS